MSTILPASQKNFKFPVSRPDDRAILSGRPSVHCSIRPDDVSSCPDARRTSIIRPDDVLLPSEPLHCIEKLLCQLTSVRTFQQLGLLLAWKSDVNLTSYFVSHDVICVWCYSNLPNVKWMISFIYGPPYQKSASEF
jgi:hypothetical protein